MEKLIKGGEFMINEIEANDIFIPEEFNEEQRMIADTCRDFLDTEVMPNLEKIDKQEDNIARKLLDKAGELGLLGISIPEEYSGFGQSFLTSMLASEVMGSAYSFSVTYSCHTGIGTMPIAYFGSHEQKLKYVTKLATGEWAGAYCLTEPGAGSDANSGKTKAVLSEDGKHYILNGQKMWITNTGFADVFTVFAKIDNDRVLSAFIVERDFPGITFNPEEKKMGIKGSSTRQIFFENCMVPVENLLGRRGSGFRIALAILHMGRIKLGGNVIGSAKIAIDQSVRYANERKQFGSLISSFGAIKFKLAQQAIKTFGAESAVYRASKHVDEYIDAHVGEMTKEEATMEAFQEYSAEAAILKVFNSEVLDYVVDEGVQIHGGMGFSAEMPIERGYRDSRINRIFEGTNEINRILVVDTTLKRGSKGIIPYFEEAKKVVGELDSLMTAKCCCTTGYYECKRANVKNLKRVALILSHYANQIFDRTLVSEQEVLNNIADIMMNLYVAESMILRTQKIENLKGEEAAKIYKDMVNVFVYDAVALTRKAGLDAVYSMADGELAEKLSKAVKHFTCVEGVNVKEARRNIADRIIAENKYPF